jgi:hypothetical protein
VAQLDPSDYFLSYPERLSFLPFPVIFFTHVLWEARLVMGGCGREE